jgi:uncharacterized membrane protein affecting hemolysin expression
LCRVSIIVIIIIIIIIIIIFSSVQYTHTHTHIPEADPVPRQYIVAVILSNVLHSESNSHLQFLINEYTTNEYEDLRILQCDCSFTGIEG